MNFRDFRISTKILTIVAGFGFALTVTAVIGWFSLEHSAKATQKAEEAAEHLKLAARLDHDALDLNRNEYKIALNPALSSEVRNEIQHDEAEFLKTIAELEERSTGEFRTMLSDIETAYQVYISDVKQTVALAEQSEIELTEEQKTLAEAVEHSVPLMTALEAKIEAYNEATEADAQRIAKEALQSAHFSEFLIVGSGILAVILGVASAVFVSRKYISRPLQRVVDGLMKVASGDLNHKIDTEVRSDEIGELNQALAKFIVTAKDKIALMEKEEEAAKAKLARANRVREITETFQRDIAEAVTSLAGAAEEMQATAVSMSSTAEETSAQTRSVSSVTVQTASNVQTVAAATEEMYAAISSVSEQMSRGAKIAFEAKSRTGTTITQLETLSSAAQSIDGILDLISKVTAQTKLLALNATIEAVRAGEAGKGFNVVAHEVKALAEQTEQATKSVTEQVKAIQDAANMIVDSVQGISGVVDEVNDVTTIVASSAEQQVGATGEISKNVSEASTGTNHVSESLIMLETAAQTTASAATQVTATAEELTHQSLNIKTRIDDYIAAVEAA